MWEFSDVSGKLRARHLKSWEVKDELRLMKEVWEHKKCEEERA
jgi:hypothetical protein